MVSEPLLAELQRKIDDGAPRGEAWPIMADILVAAAPHASTPEEVELTNKTLASVLRGDPAHMRECVAELQAYLDKES